MSHLYANRLIHRGRDFDVREMHAHTRYMVTGDVERLEDVEARREAGDPTVDTVRKRETRVEQIWSSAPHRFAADAPPLRLELTFAVLPDGGGEHGRNPVLYLAPVAGTFPERLEAARKYADEQAAIAFDALNRANVLEIQRDNARGIVLALLNGNARERKRARRRVRRLGFAR